MKLDSKPNDAYTDNVKGMGGQCDSKFWKQIKDFLAFAEGTNLSEEQQRLGVEKTEFTMGKIVAHILYVQWNRSAMLCKKARADVMKHFGGISPMLKKPCVGYGCVVCYKYNECKSGEYDGILDPFPQVVADNRYDPLTLEDVANQHLFLNQRKERALNQTFDEEDEESDYLL